jgi:hypothetical protein
MNQATSHRAPFSFRRLSARLLGLLLVHATVLFLLLCAQSLALGSLVDTTLPLLR